MVTTPSRGRTHRTTLALGALVLMMLGGCGGSGTSNSAVETSEAQATDAATASAVRCSDMATASAQALARINALRAVARQCGSTAVPAATALLWNASLASAAQAHASDMATRDYFAHTSPEGSTMISRAQQAGYASSQVAENIGAGYGTLEAALQGWLASAGHCANLMSTTYQDVALACATSSTAQYGSYWVLMLGRR
ncbi:MAG: hypothetical protein RLZZ592_2139 [Pseudomonadota bacterium]|nr:hypothetical protein [Pseudomonadota bacterium]